MVMSKSCVKFQSDKSGYENIIVKKYSRSWYTLVDDENCTASIIITSRSVKGKQLMYSLKFKWRDPGSNLDLLLNKRGAYKHSTPQLSYGKLGVFVEATAT